MPPHLYCPLPPQSPAAPCLVARRAASPPLYYPSAPRLPAGTQAFASLLHAPRRWQEVNIEFGIGEFNVENHPRRVLRNFERERGQDGFQI